MTLRESIERPEALDTGGIVMTGLNSDEVLDAVKLLVDDTKRDQAAGGVSRCP